jgi:hypothetical protein
MRFLVLGLCLSCCLALTACGEESSDADIQTGSEKALFIAYAAFQSSEEMYNIMVASTGLPVSDLISSLGAYYILYAADHDGEAPPTFDLGNPPDGVTPPAGMTGIIYTTTNDSYYTIGSNSYLDFSGYSNIMGSYSGRMKLGGQTPDDTSFSTLSKETLNPIDLIINYSDEDYSKVTFTNFSYALDNSGTYPKYTLNGNLKVDDSSYGFTNLTYTVTGVYTVSVEGTLSYGGDDYDVSGTVTMNASGIWVGGTLSITVSDEDTVEVTLSNSGATFTQGEESWEKDTWWDDRLAP